MNQNDNSLGKLARVALLYLPLGTATLILLGYYDSYTYFDFFTIDIHNSVDPTELVFSFSSLIDDLVLVAIYGTILNYVWDRFILNRVNPLVAYLAPFMIFFAFMLRVAFTMKHRKIYFHEVSEMTILIAFIFFFISSIKGLDTLSLKFSNVNSPRVKIFFAFVSVVLFISIKNEVRASQVIYSKENDKMLFDHDIKGVPRETSDSVAYIGSLRHHHFLVNLVTAEIFDIPADRVRVIVRQQNK